MGVAKEHLPLRKRAVSEPGATSRAAGELQGDAVADPDEQRELLPAERLGEPRRATGANEGERPDYEVVAVGERAREAGSGLARTVRNDAGRPLAGRRRRHSVRRRKRGGS